MVLAKILFSSFILYSCVRTEGTPQCKESPLEIEKVIKTLKIPPLYSVPLFLNQGNRVFFRFQSGEHNLYRLINLILQTHIFFRNIPDIQQLVFFSCQTRS